MPVGSGPTTSSASTESTKNRQTQPILPSSLIALVARVQDFLRSASKGQDRQSFPTKRIIQHHRRDWAAFSTPNLSSFRYVCVPVPNGLCKAGAREAVRLAPANASASLAMTSQVPRVHDRDGAGRSSQWLTRPFKMRTATDRFDGPLRPRTNLCSHCSDEDAVSLFKYGHLIRQCGPARPTRSCSTAFCQLVPLTCFHG